MLNIIISPYYTLTFHIINHFHYDYTVSLNKTPVFPITNLHRKIIVPLLHFFFWIVFNVSFIVIVSLLKANENINPSKAKTMDVNKWRMLTIFIRSFSISTQISSRNFFLCVDGIYVCRVTYLVAFAKSKRLKSMTMTTEFSY